MQKKLLVVDDEQPIVEALLRTLSPDYSGILTSNQAQKALELISSENPQVVISDVRMPQMSGLELLEAIKKINPTIQVIMITGHATVEEAVKAMKSGAYDLITKPFGKAEIHSTVNRAFDRFHLLSENQKMKEQISSGKKTAIWGKNENIEKLLAQAIRAANSQATILVQGESGTGKEILAQFIVNHSPFKEKPFVKVNCAAIPENLLESVLFGHRRGSFTGAVDDKKGKFAEANKGTIFLDEVGELPMGLQSKLLRVLQEGEIHPVGGKEVKVQVRVIAATNRDLKEQIKKGSFREDLFYRLYVIPLTLPPLRSRKEDLPELINHFLAKYSMKNHRIMPTIKPEVRQTLEEYDWPGNIRELENTIERAVILCREDEITLDDLPMEFINDAEDQWEVKFPRGANLEQIEMFVVQEYLKKNKGDKSKTAEDLGVSLRTVYRKLDQYNLSPASEQEEKEVQDSEINK